MSDQMCSLCGKLFNDGDTVRARVIAKWVGLKSKRIYALSKPTDCESVSHVECSDPKMELNGD